MMGKVSAAKLGFIEELLGLDEDTGRGLADKFMKAILVENAWVKNETAENLLKLIDESPNIRYAAMAGACLATALHDSIPEDSLIALQEKRDDLVSELIALDKLIFTKAHNGAIGEEIEKSKKGKRDHRRG